MLIMFAVFPGCQEQQAPPQVEHTTFMRQMDDVDRQAKIIDAQLERSSVNLDKSDVQVERFDRLLKRWEEQADRYDKILDKWEQQRSPLT
jgi:hypothetical protein